MVCMNSESQGVFFIVLYSSMAYKWIFFMFFVFQELQQIHQWKVNSYSISFFWFILFDTDGTTVEAKNFVYVYICVNYNYF